MNNSGKILFVDDDPLFLAAIERTLRNRFVLDTALSGKAAIERLKSHGPYAVIVSDIDMPEMDGIELLSRVSNESPQTIRIALTGQDDLETFTTSVRQTKVFRYVVKSFDGSLLREALVDGLKQHAMDSGLCADADA